MQPRIMMVNLEGDDLTLFNKIKNSPKFYNYDEKVLKFIISRGINTEKEIEAFLFDNVNNLSNPSEMKDSDKFCDIVNEAVDNDEEIIFYTDYDMDGIGAGRTGVKGLRTYCSLKNSKSSVNWYANDRFIEGYGITADGVDNLVAKYPNVKLIITTDNGIVGYAGVARAKELGLKIIVTDHHQEGDTPTVADAIIDPHQKDCKSTFKHLCGAGVIFKLLMKLYWDAGFPLDSVYDLLDVVALSTVADMVPLIGDNRIIVKEGLKLVMDESRPCKIFKILREEYNNFAISESAHITQINEEVFGFTYGPAFNSLGRMYGTIDKAMDFLFSDDEQTMRLLAKEIFEINDMRKQITTEYNTKLLEETKALYPTEDDLPPILIIKEDLIPEGIVGLVATHLKDYFHRPCVVLCKVSHTKIDANGNQYNEEKYKGSARSIDGFDINKSFKENNTYILGHGGHAAAAGVNVAIDEFDDFKKAMTQYASKHITEEMFVNKIYVDFGLSISEVNEDFIYAFESIRPFGISFEKPKIGISDMIIDKYKYKVPDWTSCFCGKDGTTVRLVDQTGFTAIMFRHPETFQDLLDRCDLNADKIIVKPIGYPSLNLFNGVYYPQLVIENNYIF